MSNRFVQYTLAARAGGNLIPFAKVNAHFQDDDQLAMKKFIKEHTIERFGPVYSLKAELVFTISYESVQESKRHKCGFVLKKPTFISWDKDLTLDQAIDLEVITSQL